VETEVRMDDIRCSCSNCGTRLLADESDAGGQAECPKCAAPVAIPGDTPTSPALQEKQYYIYKNGEQMGPYLLSQITSLISQGKLSDTDWAWMEGMDDWKPLSMTPGIIPPQLKPAQMSLPAQSPLGNDIETLFPDADAPSSSEIDSLSVSDSWKETFQLIEEAGGLEGSWMLCRLKYPKALTWKERAKLSFCFWAFILGPFYYLVKGMWAKALIYFAVIIALGGILQLLTGIQIGYAASIFYSTWTKYDYYLFKVKKNQLW
jgi:hypothetical protein